MGIRLLPIAAVALLAACDRTPQPAAPASTATPPPVNAAPAGKVIVAKRGGFVPEGIEYDQANDRFLTGSLAEGTIFSIAEDGSVTPFVTDSALVSSVGIEVDEPRDRLLVCNSDRGALQSGQPGQAKLGVYSLTTGERLAMVDLAAAIDEPSNPPAYFANDVTVDNDGNAYVTDTRMNAIYRVTPDYRASVLYRFTSLPDGVALNGIVYHSNGYLLVVAAANIYKVPVDDPAAMTQVAVSEPVPSQDGAVWSADGPLAVVSNVADAPLTVKLASDDDWATARRVGAAKLSGQATTAAAMGGDIYAIHPHFNDREPPTIEQAVFD